MAEQVINISGSVHGDKELDMALAQAPHLIKGQVIHQWKKERDMFIGKRGGKPGVFKKKLMRKKTFGGREGRNSGRWSPQFAGLVRGKVTAGPSNTMNGLYLGMGHFFKSQKPIHKAFDMMATGGTITSGTKAMIIPIYENLKAVMPVIKTGRSHIILKNYASLTGRSEGIVRISAGGKSLYYDKQMFREAQYERALMFVGIHRIVIKKQLNFEGDFMRRVPKMVTRTQKAVDRAIDKINKS